MKSILLIYAMVWTGSLFAQEANKSQPEKSDAFLRGNLLDQAWRGNKSITGTIYMLQQDMMPCLSADMDIVKTMPNGFQADANIEHNPVPYYYLPRIPENFHISRRKLAYTKKTLSFEQGRAPLTGEADKLLNKQRYKPVQTPGWARPGSRFK